MAWHQKGAKPLPEQMMTQSTDMCHQISITHNADNLITSFPSPGGQWVKLHTTIMSLTVAHFHKDAKTPEK